MNTHEILHSALISWAAFTITFFSLTWITSGWRRAVDLTIAAWFAMLAVVAPLVMDAATKPKPAQAAEASIDELNRPK